MSEYQYYEWQTIDRALSDKERTEVNKLSSHIEAGGRSADPDQSGKSLQTSRGAPGAVA
jgi:hypothetical protein